MNPLTEVEERLYEKISKTNVRNPKANTGAALIKMNPEWQDKIGHYVAISFATIQQQFSRQAPGSPIGEAKLTHLSILIGKQVGSQLKRQPLDWTVEVRLGDLFIEAYKKTKLIELIYDRTRTSNYYIKVTKNWTDIVKMPGFKEKIAIQGTVEEPPAIISGMSQYVIDREVTIIKRGEDPIDTGAPWVKSINNLQQVGWRINTRVLDAVKANQDLFTSDIPIEDNDAKEQKRVSKYVEWSFITEKADKLRDVESLHQYLDADYRGRLYYMEPFLNFQGPDLARGLLSFSKYKPMTEDGKRWLAIHTAASYNMSYSIDEIPSWCEEDYHSHLKKEGLDNISVDKMTLSDRVEWTNQYMEEIIDAGEAGSITKDAEKPVAFLACCYEWLDIFEAENDDRVHMTNIPIPIDGSNNGWQHLGAISKDKQTGSLVGLVPIKIQKDFYVQTAKKLLEICKNDRLNKILEQMPMKKIRKGISKRGSMTRAYSAGAAKIGENMYFDCKTEDYHIDYDINEKDCMKLAGLLIKSIDEVCPGPLTTMKYLQDLAIYEIGKYERVDENGESAVNEYKVLSKRLREIYDVKIVDRTEEMFVETSNIIKRINSFTSELVYGNGSSSLRWTTPSQFHVHYRNFHSIDGKIKGTIDGKTINHVAKVNTDSPDIRGFVCGVSPNYIHSMDASHMSLVISQWEGDFGAVHDSFSTHASEVDELLFRAKEVFIEMYDVPNFYDEIKKIVTDKTQLDVEQPRLGELNIGDIYDSEYFFA